MSDNYVKNYVLVIKVPDASYRRTMIHVYIYNFFLFYYFADRNLHKIRVKPSELLINIWVKNNEFLKGLRRKRSKLIKNLIFKIKVGGIDTYFKYLKKNAEFHTFGITASSLTSFNPRKKKGGMKNK